VTLAGADRVTGSVAGGVSGSRALQLPGVIEGIEGYRRLSD
jgi:hypothetical protein